MKKAVLALVSVLLLPPLAIVVEAEGPPWKNLPREAVTNVIQTCTGLQYHYNVGISSQSPTSIINNSTTTWRQASIQNLDATAYLYFSYDPYVSSSVPTGYALGITTHTVGTKISPGQIVTASLVPGVTYYALNDTATRATFGAVDACR